VNLRRAVLAAMTVAIVHAAPDPTGRDCPVETRLCPSTLVTTSAVSLPWTNTLVRSRETAIANLIATSMHIYLAARCEPALGVEAAPSPALVGNHPLACRVNYAAGEYIAFTNTGGIRAGLGKGSIDSAMVAAVVPFKNQARFASVNGTIIKLMLENGVSDVAGAAGRFPAVHGMEFEYDPARPAGSRVTRVEVSSPGPTAAESRRGRARIPSDDEGPTASVSRCCSTRALSASRSWLKKST
jgi:2',3'-cyclic-nucleotide 2'-phosphodiesterase (5'-nucleotidase family)